MNYYLNKIKLFIISFYESEKWDLAPFYFELFLYVLLILFFMAILNFAIKY